MNQDFRLSTAFFDNIKTVKLIRQLGSDGIVGLLKIWTYTARHRPAGDFPFCSPEDLEIIANWTGIPSALMNTLLDLNFIEKTESGFRVHDWEEHNHWASGAATRSQKARKAARARWERADAPSIDEHCPEHANRNAPLLSLQKEKTLGDLTNGFTEFYLLYPLKKNPKRAKIAWEKALKKGNGTAQEIMDALGRQTVHKAHLRMAGQFCPEWPHPSTWLNDERWNDDIPQAQPEKGNGGWAKIY